MDGWVARTRRHDFCRDNERSVNRAGMGWQGTEVRREEDQGGVVEQRVVTSERQSGRSRWWGLGCGLSRVVARRVASHPVGAFPKVDLPPPDR
jgi:hypothetical protein